MPDFGPNANWLTASQDSTTGAAELDQSTGGEKHTVTGSSSVWSYGSWQNQLFPKSAGVTTGAAEVMATLTNLQPYSRFGILVSAFTATSFDITVSMDAGSTFVAALPSKDSLVVTPAAIVAVGYYILEGKFDQIKLTQAGAGGVTAQFSPWVA